MKFLSCLPLIVCTVHAFSPTPCKSSPSLRRTTELNMYESVEAAIAEAQRICAADPTSDECRVAWDIVEELEAADSHKQKGTEQDGDGSSMDYAALMGSFDILTAKIEGKMDQLKATAIQMEALGAPPPVTDLARIADEMKQALANAKATMR